MCKKDIPGFVGNRLQHALKREAIALVAAGVCDAETIDTVVKCGFGARMAVLGPMEQSDLVGLDLTLDIQNVLIADLDNSTEPTQFLKDKVASGKLGMRTGEGFRRWTKESADAVRERLRHYLAEQAKAAKRSSYSAAAAALPRIAVQRRDDLVADFVHRIDRRHELQQEQLDAHVGVFHQLVAHLLRPADAARLHRRADARIILRTSASGSSGVSSFLACSSAASSVSPKATNGLNAKRTLRPYFAARAVHAVHGAAQAVLDAGEVGRALVVVEEPPVGVFRHHLQPARAAAGGEDFRRRTVAGFIRSCDSFTW